MEKVMSEFRDACGNWEYSDGSQRVGTPKSNEYRNRLVDQAIKNLKEKLLDEAKPLPPELSKTVDKHFWGLI
jgi:hypothetical protein